MNHSTSRFLTRATMVAFLAMLGAPGLRAQGDPTQEILELARQVDEQLREVDRLLLESSNRNQQTAAPKDLLERSMEHNAAATDGIERLIEKLTEMKNSGGGGQSQQQQDQQQQQQQQQQQDGQQQQQQQGGQQQNRRENNAPDFAEQPKPGEQQGEQQQGQQDGQQPEGGKPGEQGNPQGGKEKITPGMNRDGNSPPENATGPGQRGEGSESWGELQPYLNSLKNRGSTPKVPQKYRKYWEAYLKNKKGSDKSGGGR